VVVTDEGARTSGGAVTVEEPYSWSPRSVRPYTGINVDSPTQFMMGAKLDMGPVTRTSDFHFLPELSLGFGDGATTFLAAGNLEYMLRDVDEKGAWSPYLGAGLGFLSSRVDGDSHTEGVVNIYYGLTANFGKWTVFAEHEGVDLFDLNRLLAGLRLAL
jgi:hypothetical protein